MSGLSNFFRKDDASAAAALTVRHADAGEIDAALAVLLGQGGRPAEPAAVRDFARFAFQRGLSLGKTVVAIDDEDRVVAAALPVPNPGRTALILTSTAGTSRVVAAAIGRCAAEVCNDLKTTDVRLAQFLLEEADYRVVDALRGVGCSDLTTLIYLQRSGFKAEAPVMPEPCDVWTYSPQTHARFAKAIEATYAGSLDCPALHGKRDIEDIVEGHKAAGEFHPDFWFCLTQGESPLGVLLLAPVPGHATMELVYIGLTAEARGRGFGDFLVKKALHQTTLARLDQLTLAVDADNQPALRLYYRHGFGEVHRRVAMMRGITGGF